MSALVLVVLLAVLLYLFAVRNPRTERRGRANLAILALLAAYAAAAVVWLLAGLAPAIVHAVPALDDVVAGWARGEGGFAALAQRVVSASRACEGAMELTELRLVPIGQVAVNYLFSAVDIVLAVLLLRLRPADWTARLLAIGLIGTGAVFNAQAHCAPDVLAGSAAPFFVWLHDYVFHLVSGVAYVYALLLFPDGKFVPRWSKPWLKWPVRVLYAFLLAALGLMFVGFFHGTDPSGFVAFFGVVIPVAGVTSQAFRYRHAASQEERQQSRALVWTLALAFGASVVFGLITWVLTTLGGSTRSLEELKRVVFLVFPLLFAVIPIALFVILVRYRLWDIEKVINKTLVYGSLAGLITAIYVGIVVGIGALVGSRGEPNIALSILATAIVAVAFQPARQRVQRLANRLVYGRRATPYEVLSEFSERVAGAYSREDLLPRMARILAEGTGAARAELWIKVGPELRRAAWWPEDAWRGRESLPMSGEELPSIPSDRVIPVHHQRELLGALSLTKPAGEPLTPAEDKLAADLASQAGLVLRNVRLTEELLARLDELQASRKRLVAAQDEERRRLERNIHDGAQQQLVSLAMKLRLVETLMDRDPAKARQLVQELQADSGETLENLRDLARGIYPPLLQDQGLAAALEAQARKSPLPVTVEADSLGRYPQEAEAAVYFCCLEALQNVAKYARATNVRVTLAEQDGELVFTVRDDGMGFDATSTPKGSGLQNMADRLAALGGRLAVSSKPGEGTAVSGWVPASAPDEDGSADSASAAVQPPLAAAHASARRSGPNDDLGM